MGAGGGEGRGGGGVRPPSEQLQVCVVSRLSVGYIACVHAGHRDVPGDNGPIAGT